MKKILIFGISTLSEMLFEFFTSEERARFAGFVVNRDYIVDPELYGFPLIAFEDVCQSHPPCDYEMIMPLRYIENNCVRERLFKEVKALGYDLPGYIHPSCVIAEGVQKGENVICFSDNVIRSQVVLEDNVFLWSAIVIKPGVRVCENSFLASRSVFEENVVIAKNTFIGPRTTVTNGVKIGKYSVIGSGCLICRDTKDESIYGAMPAQDYS